MKFWQYKKIFSLTIGIFIWQFLVLPIKSFASTTPIRYVPLEGEAFRGFNTPTGGNELGHFLSQAFQFGLALSAVLAVVMIIWGGVQTMLTDSPFGKDEGKNRIKGALGGLALALTAWLILYTINPEILNFKL